MTTGTIELKASDFRSGINPDWCPGCGDFGVLNSLQRACAELGLQPHRILTVSGIGCSSNLPGYINSYGMHTLHGRSLAFATGAKLANHELTVIATGGDGDGYGIGGNHLTHTARRNVDITYIVMNNQIYGLTTGQISPTSRLDMKTKSTPYGNVETPINPITSAIMNGASYVARAYSGDIRHTTAIIKAAIEHKGFSLVDIFSPCVTFNDDNSTISLRKGDPNSRIRDTMRAIGKPLVKRPWNGDPLSILDSFSKTKRMQVWGLESQSLLMDRYPPGRLESPRIRPKSC